LKKNQSHKKRRKGLIGDCCHQWSQAIQIFIIY
jgi:hypothetical protein